jgi:hypothetical protein
VVWFVSDGVDLGADWLIGRLLRLRRRQTKVPSLRLRVQHMLIQDQLKLEAV